MDYAEYLIRIKAHTKALHESLLNRDWRESESFAIEIATDARAIRMIASLKIEEEEQDD
jgi:hypothetical protein